MPKQENAERENALKDQPQRLLAFETFDQSDEESTTHDQQKGNAKDDDNDI